MKRLLRTKIALSMIQGLTSRLLIAALVPSYPVMSLELYAEEPSGAYVMGAVTGTNIGDETLATAKALLKAELSRSVHSKRSKSAESESANTLVDLVLTRLETMTLVKLQLRAEDQVIRLRETKIVSIDELDVAIQRLLSAALENTEVKNTAERGRVTALETKEASRVNAIDGFEISLGTAQPFTEAMGTYKPMYSLGLGYMWDVDDFLVELRGDLMAGFNNLKSSAWSTTVGAHYVWKSERQYALFSGLEFGFGGLQSHRVIDPDNSKSGFVVYADTGLILLRHANINLDLRLRAGVLTETLNESIPVHGGLLVGVRF